MELFTTGLLLKVAKKAGIDSFKREMARNTDAAAGQYREEMDELAVELANRVEALEHVIIRFVGSDDNRRIIRHLDLEIAREALPVRRRMLAEAGLGLARIGLPVARAARVARTLRGLDAADIRHLHALQLGRVAHPRSDGQCSEDLMWTLNASEGENLVAEHCVRLLQAGYGGVARPCLTITERGHDLLAALSAYLDEVGPLTSVEELPSDRGAAEPGRQRGGPRSR